MKALTPKFPHLLHGGDYNPDQWLDCPGVLETDIQRMKEAKINCVSLAIFAWAKLEPREGEYDFDWLEQVIENLYQNGIYTILATPSGAKPIWMSEKYPEIRRVRADGRRDQSGGRHNHCYTSPKYREKVRQMDTALAQRFSKHPGVILWHLSNEYEGECYCPACQAAFRRWLQEKYGTLEALNHQWWNAFWSHTVTSWEEIHAPAAEGEGGVFTLMLDWKRFVTDQVVDFVKMERDAVKAVDPSLPVTINMMYDYYGYNYSKFRDVIDVASWDSYPQWRAGDNAALAADFAFEHDKIRSLKKQPFLLMESTPSATNWWPVSRLKRPGMHLAASMQAVGHGSNSVQYFQIRKSRGSFEKFHGAVIDHYDGNDTRVFQDVAALGRRLEALDQVGNTTVAPEVALVYDVENRWAMENAAGPRNCGIHYREQILAHYRALWEQGIPVDVIDEEGDLNGYKLVVAPMLYLLRAGFSQKLRDFVEQGGTLVGTYLTGLVNENDLCLLGGWPGEGLQEVFGVWNEDTDALWDGEENQVDLDNGRSYKAKELCALLHGRGAQALGVYSRDFYAGEAAVTVNRFGQGKAFYIGAFLEQDFYRDFYRKLGRELEVKRALAVELPRGVEACLRENQEEAYVFLQNFSGARQTMALPAGWQLLTPQGRTPQGQTSQSGGDSVTLAPYDSQTLWKRK